MSDNDLLNTSIDEYLISLANSVNHAQRYIGRLRLAGEDGKPTITYQLPRVDFELKMLFQVAKTPPPSGGRQRDIAKAEGGGWLEARPASVETGEAGAATSRVTSTIKGSFVSVPIHGGAPPPLIETSWFLKPANSADVRAVYEIRVSIHSGAGEPLAFREVQFNIDRELYAQLNHLSTARPAEQTRLRDGVVLTDANGIAVNELTVAQLEGDSVPVVIDAMDETETLVFTGPVRKAKPAPQDAATEEDVERPSQGDDDGDVG